MARIYAKAERVVIWLGTTQADSLTSEIAMEEFGDPGGLAKISRMITEKDQIWKWASLLDLMNNTYWKRMWVIQELVVANDVIIQCGNSKMHFGLFRDAVALFSASFETLRPKLMQHLEGLHQDKKHWALDPDLEIGNIAATQAVDALSTFRRNQDGTLQQTKSLETLLCLFQDRIASDPRDKVYALLALAKDGSYFNPNYSKSVFSVYKQFVQHSINTTQSLDIICHRWARQPSPSGSESRSTSRLPSWMLPDDEYEYGSRKGEGNLLRSRKASDTFVGILDKKSYTACGAGSRRKHPAVVFPGTTMVDGQMTESTCLMARGTAIGSITFCTQSMTDCVIPGACFEKLGFSRGTRNKDNARLQDRVWRTLVADRGPDNTTCPSWYPRAAQHCLEGWLCNGHLNTDRAIYETVSYATPYLARVRNVIRDRTFFELKSNIPDSKEHSTLFGLGPSHASEGDLIVILHGCSVPVVIRPVHIVSGSQGYRFIGEAFVYGRMEGEIFDTDYEEVMYTLV
ncbi:hypothetical protein SNOG_09975 [Parastagonospora nodorum SN15]|nr:hypothetical protein SNOG_09975 [Parastagonospora nodorum SN15]EAT82310.1 hypothetical protein SNOG_09975 [Parastagonospora nodorum SN15]